MSRSTRPSALPAGRIRIVGRSDRPRPRPGRLLCLLPPLPLIGTAVGGTCRLAVAADQNGRGYRVLAVLDGGRCPPTDGPRPPGAARAALPRAA